MLDPPLSRRDLLAALASAAGLALISACARHPGPTPAAAAPGDADALALLDQIADNFLSLFPESATSLGVDTSYAGRMRDAYWKDAYPALSPAYRTSACRDGSDLDLDSTRHAFP